MDIVDALARQVGEGIAEHHHLGRGIHFRRPLLPRGRGCDRGSGPRASGPGLPRDHRTQHGRRRGLLVRDAEQPAQAEPLRLRGRPDELSRVIAGRIGPLALNGRWRIGTGRTGGAARLILRLRREAAGCREQHDQAYGQAMDPTHGRGPALFRPGQYRAWGAKGEIGSAPAAVSGSSAIDAAGPSRRSRRGRGCDGAGTGARPRGCRSRACRRARRDRSRARRRRSCTSWRWSWSRDGSCAGHAAWIGRPPAIRSPR